MKDNGNGTNSHYDYLIIGAGPAGLQLGYFLQKANRSYLILEAGDVAGSFFQTFPRHRTLISINKVYTGTDDPEINLRWDWNSLLSESDAMLFKNYTERYFPQASDLLQYLADFASHFGLKIRYATRVVKVTKDDVFRVYDGEGNLYSCSRLIVATGNARPYVPDIPGIEACELYTSVSVDPNEFKNQRVLILGKGNSGFETADNLVEKAAVIHIASRNPLKMAWQTHFVGHLRAVNNNILDSYQLKSQNAIIDATIDKIERRDGKFLVSVSYAHADGEQETLSYDRVIVCTGFRFDDSIFDESCRPELVIDDRFPAQTSEWESTNVKDLYFAGALTQVRDYKKTTSGFIHGFRYNVRALHRIFEQKYHGQPWPSYTVPLSAERLMQAVIKRVNTSSGLWQQFGFLCDVIAVPNDATDARYYEEVPVAYVHDSDLGRHEQYYTVTLEYGPEYAFSDPFKINRIERNDVSNSHLSNFLHPIVRRFSGPNLITEHHIIEDFASQWLEDVHTQPLLRFFDGEMPAPVHAGLSLSSPPQ